MFREHYSSFVRYDLVNIQISLPKVFFLLDPFMTQYDAVASPLLLFSLCDMKEEEDRKILCSHIIAMFIRPVSQESRSSENITEYTRVTFIVDTLLLAVAVGQVTFPVSACFLYVCLL